MPISLHQAQDGLRKALRLLTRHAEPSPSGSAGLAQAPHKQLTKRIMQFGASKFTASPRRKIAQGGADGASLPASAGRAHPAQAATTDTTCPAATATDTAVATPISVPVLERNEDDIASRTAFDHGQHLARQEQWPQLMEALIQADTARNVTPSQVPIADIMAFGARADVVNSVEHALNEGLRTSERITVDGIMALERVRLELKRAPFITAFVAQAHLDLAHACRRHPSTAAPSTRHRPTRGKHGARDARAEAHFDRAHALMAEITGETLNSPFVAATKCALYAGRPVAAQTMADDYAALIALTPKNPRVMRALGGLMLRHGGPQILELEARRTAALVQDHWGSAGYAWVYFDALAHSDHACETVDLQFFRDGLADIVRHAPDQGMINLLAAYCSIAMQSNGSEEASLAVKSHVRREISAATSWLVRDHLREIHPMIWAHAAEGFDNDANVSSPRRFAERGRVAALQVIATLFQDEIARGRTVSFTERGPVLA